MGHYTTRIIIACGALQNKGQQYKMWGQYRTKVKTIEPGSQHEHNYTTWGKITEHSNITVEHIIQPIEQNTQLQNTSSQL